MTSNRDDKFHRHHHYRSVNSHIKANKLTHSPFISMPSIDIVDAEHFTDYVNRDVVTIICFSAVWCGPCRQIAKDLDKLAYEFPAANFLKVDADTNPDIFQKCSVTVLPTFLAVRQGKELGHIIGADVKGLKSLLRMIC